MLKRATKWQAFRRKLQVPGTAEEIAVDKTRLSSAYKISLTVDRAVFIIFDLDISPNETNALEIEAGSYSEDNISIDRWIRFVNRNVGEKPLVRGILWGE